MDTRAKEREKNVSGISPAIWKASFFTDITLCLVLLQQLNLIKGGVRESILLYLYALLSLKRDWM